jgi:SAM-dependent methyltransferase
VFHPGGPTLVELARQALSSTRRGYDLLAPKFDRTPFRTPDWLLDQVAPHLGAPGSIGRAVDLCCGTGAAFRILRPLCRDVLVGADFSLGMLAEARRHQRGPGKPVALVQQDLLGRDLCRDTFTPGCFELATIFGALGHIRPREQAAFLAAVRGWLAPRGRLVLVVAPTPPPWSPSLWLAAGFDLAMWVRNVALRPPFVMYYLAWPLRRTRRLLAAAGFAVEERPLALAGRPTRARLLIATAAGSR